MPKKTTVHQLTCTGKASPKLGAKRLLYTARDIIRTQWSYLLPLIVLSSLELEIPKGFLMNLFKGYYVYWSNSQQMRKVLKD